MTVLIIKKEVERKLLRKDERNLFVKEGWKEVVNNNNNNNDNNNPPILIKLLINLCPTKDKFKIANC